MFPIPLKQSWRKAFITLRWLAFFLCFSPAALAQIDSEFLSRTSPRTPFDVPEPAKYNLKWGSLKARIFGSIQGEFNDNINLSQQHQEMDFSIGPEARVGFVWPINRIQSMEFNVAFGYRWYMLHPELNTYSIRPGSRFDYKLTIEDVQVLLFNTFSLETDPTTRPELNGTNSQTLINFRRLTDTFGLLAHWQPTTDLTLSAGYDYTIDRTLSDQFGFLDRDGQSFNASAYYALTPRWKVGATALYGIDNYLQRIQNDGDHYSLSPTIFYQPTEFTTLNAAVGYSVSTFRHTGSLTDSSDYAGLIYSGGIRHVINRRASHSLQFSKNANLGIGSNFSDTFTAQYALNWRLAQPVLLNTTLAYDHYKASGTGGESADRLLAYLGTTLTLTKRWSLALGYAFGDKISNTKGNDYLQNRVTMELARQF